MVKYFRIPVTRKEYVHYSSAYVRLIRFDNDLNARVKCWGLNLSVRDIGRFRKGRRIAVIDENTSYNEIIIDKKEPQIQLTPNSLNIKLLRRYKQIRCNLQYLPNKDLKFVRMSETGSTPNQKGILKPTQENGCKITDLAGFNTTFVCAPVVVPAKTKKPPPKLLPKPAPPKTTTKPPPSTPPPVESTVGSYDLLLDTTPESIRSPSTTPELIKPIRTAEIVAKAIIRPPELPDTTTTTPVIRPPLISKKPNDYESMFKSFIQTQQQQMNGSSSTPIMAEDDDTYMEDYETLEDDEFDPPKRKRGRPRKNSTSYSSTSSFSSDTPRKPWHSIPRIPPYYNKSINNQSTKGKRGRPRKFGFKTIYAEIKTIALPSDLWSAHLSVTPRRSQVCFTRVLQPVSEQVPVECDRSVKFNDSTNYMVRINTRRVELIGAPKTVDSLRDVEILLEIVNDIDSNDCMLEYHR